MDYCASPKVLLLGISYPDVRGHMAEHDFDADILQHSESSVDQAVECVRRKILTEMDGRDLARCVATEQAGGGHEVYTVSKEMGGIYRNDRHVYASFNNSRGMRRAMHKAFGHVRFQQVILDYYWMPTGWLVTRWNKTLFQDTLPDLVKHDMLAYPGSRQRSPRKRSATRGASSSSSSTEIELEEGVVFLPFCAHVCKELVGGIDKLKQYFSITFVKKSELPGHALWKGTMSIDGEVMQHRLGKRLDQEEVYCTFQPKDIYESMEDAHVNKDDVMEMLLSIEDFENVRMIRLRPLRQHEPPSVFRNAAVQPEPGGFFGLDWEKGRLRFRDFKRRKIKPAAPPPPPLKTKAVVVKIPDSGSEVETDCGEYATESDMDSDSNSDEDEHHHCDDDDSAAVVVVVDDSDGNDSYDENSIEQTKRKKALHAGFDPCDPVKIPVTTHYFPYPALDLASYMIDKDVIENDRVMAFYNKTWGPKSSRRTNKKQEIARDDFQRFRKTQRDFMSRNPRCPLEEQQRGNGYRWTLDDGYHSERSSSSSSHDGNHGGSDVEENVKVKPAPAAGWKVSLKGDDPRAHLVPKILQLAKRDTTVIASRQLFEMKNPGFKTLSRTWENQSSYMSCYQIPKHSVLMKIEKARVLAKTAAKAARKKPPETETVYEDDDWGESDSGGESDSSSSEVVAAALSDIDPSASCPLSNLADVATTTPLLTEDYRRLCRDSKGFEDSSRLVYGNGIDPTNPKAYRPRPVPKSRRYNLSPDNPQFPKELCRLLNDAEERILDHILGWQERGRSFVVRDPDRFDSLVAHRYCDPPDLTHQSFLSTLMSYNFSEIQTGTRKGGYRHNLFQRDKPKRLDRLIAEGSGQLVLMPGGIEMDASKSKAPSRRRKVDSVRAGTKDDGDATHGGIPRHFPRKALLANLYRLLRNTKVLGIADAIHWEDDGKSFRVHKLKPKFSTLVLETHLSMESYSKFQQELLDRGFHCRDGKKYGIFEHPSFARGQRSTSDSFDDIKLAVMTKKKETLKEKPTRKRPRPQPDATAKKKARTEKAVTTDATEITNIHNSRAKRRTANKSTRVVADALRSSPKRPIAKKASNTSDAPTASRTNGRKPNARTRRAPVPYEFKRSNFGFLCPLHRILEDAEERGFSKYIRWLPNGKGFFVAEASSFEQNFLTVFTRLKKFETFDNYLTWFGFEETPRNKGTAYRHIDFCRGGQDKFASIEPLSNFRFTKKSNFAEKNSIRRSKSEASTGSRKPKPDNQTSTASKKPKPDKQISAPVKFPRRNLSNTESKTNKPTRGRSTKSTRSQTKQTENLPPTLPNSKINRISSPSSQSETHILSPGDESSISPYDTESQTETSTSRRNDPRLRRLGVIDSSPDLSTRRLFPSPTGKTTEINADVTNSGTRRSRATKLDSEEGKKRKIGSTRTGANVLSSPKPKKTRGSSTERMKPVVAKTPKAFTQRRGIRAGESPARGRKAAVPVSDRGLQKRSRTTKVGGIVTKNNSISAMHGFSSRQRGKAKIIEDKPSSETRSLNSRLFRLPYLFPLVRSTVGQIMNASRFTEDQQQHRIIKENEANGLWGDSRSTKEAKYNMFVPTAVISPPSEVETVETAANPSDLLKKHLQYLSLTRELLDDILSIFGARFGKERCQLLQRIIIWHSKIQVPDSVEIGFLSQWISASFKEDPDALAFSVHMLRYLLIESCMNRLSRGWYKSLDLPSARDFLANILHDAFTEITTVCSEITNCYDKHQEAVKHQREHELQRKLAIQQLAQHQAWHKNQEKELKQKIEKQLQQKGELMQEIATFLQRQDRQCVQHPTYHNTNHHGQHNNSNSIDGAKPIMNTITEVLNSRSLLPSVDTTPSTIDRQQGPYSPYHIKTSPRTKFRTNDYGSSDNDKNYQTIVNNVNLRRQTQQHAGTHPQIQQVPPENPVLAALRNYRNFSSNR